MQKYGKKPYLPIKGCLLFIYLFIFCKPISKVNAQGQVLHGEICLSCDYKIYINHFNINSIQIESYSNIDYLKRITASKAMTVEKEKRGKRGVSSALINAM